MDNQYGTDESDEGTMKTSDAWALRQTNQNVMVRVANLPVMARFGPRSETATRKPAKPKKDNQFIVGETELGGEEVV